MNKLRSLGWVWMVLGGLLLIVLQRSTAALDFPAAYSGVAQIAGPLQLDLALTPPIVTPGDTLTLTLRLLNQAQVTHTPQVTVQFPGSIRPEISWMPSGATLNLQNNSLSWLPVVSANGGEQVLTLSLRVETADMNQPEQVVTAVLQYEQQSFTTSTTLWIGIPPQVSDILSPPQAAVGLPVPLRATFSGSAPITAHWQPGDGRQISVAEPVIVYPAAGVYEIILTASNPAGSTSYSRFITIVPHPAAQFTPDDDMPGVGQQVNFLNQSGGEPPLRYLWEFGDGTTADSVSPSHSYNTPGLYQVHLTIENQYGKSEAFWPILVNSPPLADMSLPESGQAGLAVVGQAYGDESVTGFRWDMGDGHSYDGVQVSHVYRQTGDYYVTLLATNEFGGTQIGRWLHIEPGILQTFLPLVLQLSGGAEPVVDPYGLNLPPVTLETPFVLTPIAVPANSTPPEQLFIYINEARRQFQLQPLAYQYPLSIAAQQHTNDMATYNFTGHGGSDGSFPAERLLWAGYRAGYAGEATAWGFEHPYQAVEFWINSPAHRSIILNQYASEVGVGFSVNYNSPNVWYWTAEFGTASAPMTQPVLRLGEPATNLETMVTTPVLFSWNWPLPLEVGQQFGVYLWSNGRLFPMGQVTQPVWGTRYEWETAVTDWAIPPGSYEWLVKLENNQQPILESEHRLLSLVADPNQPTPTPTPTITPTPIPTVLPTATPIPTLPWPTYTPLPPPPTPVILVTATPQP